MFKQIIATVLLIMGLQKASAQLLDSYVHQAEMGVSAGLGHYFGDLDPNGALNHPKGAAGIFFRKQLTDYVGVRLSGDYTFLGYADKYSSNPAQRERNLSFNTNVWEISVSGDFNFLKFQPGFDGYNFTPYIGLGVGFFSYDPYAYLNGVKYYLRPLGTEGQGSPLYPNLHPYGPIALCVPFTVGVKYALTLNTNIFAEFCYRFTSTDYLDDVSGTYAPDAFPPLPDGSPSPAYLLQDRSYELGTPIGVKGKQRGNSSQKDAFATLKIGLSFNLETYRCPTPSGTSAR